MIIDWITRDERHRIGDTHRTDFKTLYQRTGMVEEHPLVKNFLFLRGGDLLAFPRLPDYRDSIAKLKPFSEIKAECHFLSHRWLTPAHPDPEGRQLAILRRHLNPDAYYWVDFSSLPQKPRSQQEEAMFRTYIQLLPSLMFKMNFIVLRCENDRYFERAWCFFELLAAHVLGTQISYVYETPQLGARVHADEQRVLERTLLERSLPDDLAATDPEDMEAIKEATKTVATFSLVNLVSHYLGLGQILSENTYFYLEDRYYFMATCDFTKMLLWVFEQCHELGLTLADLSRDEFQENIFVRLAAKRQYHHSTEVYALPKEIALDQARLRWLSENKHKLDSATNLFYLLSSMVTPLSPSTPASADSGSEKAPVQPAAQLSQPGGDGQAAFQKWGHPDRLSIELDCPPGDPRPPEVFAMAIAQTGLSPDDFEDSGNRGYGRREYLVKADAGAIARYREARPTVKARLKDYYNRGMVRAATW